MLVTTKEMELLKIICWCKNIPSPAGTVFKDFCDKKQINTLQYFGFISISKDGKNIRPRPVAYRMLMDAGINFRSDAKPQTKANVTARRNMSAQILFTFYRAGISVFNDSLDNQVTEPLYIASFAARQKDSNNPFGNARFYGIFCTRKEAFLVYNTDDIGIYFQNEIKLFHNYIQQSGAQKSSIIMMGKTTTSIAALVFNNSKIGKKPKFATDSFAKIFETTSLPIYFVPIGENGSQILKIITVPNYREVLAQNIMSSQYKPPYESLPDTDTKHHLPPNNPAVIAVDMDVKRIDRAVEETKQNNFERLVLYALPEQLPFLQSRYGNLGYVDVIGINLSSLKKSTTININLYNPPKNLYISEEGRFFDASDFDTNRKIGK